MRKLIVLFFLIFVSVSSYAQKSEVSKNDSIIAIIPELLDDIAFRIRGLDRYKLYPTENIYTLLKLDTSTGKIKQLQWSLNNSNELEVWINLDDLTFTQTGSGTFELYPTKNMYQFILLNKVNGQAWHVQWGMEDSNRWIRKIY